MSENWRMAAKTCGITGGNGHNLVPKFAYFGTCQPEKMGTEKIKKHQMVQALKCDCGAWAQRTLKAEM